MARFQFRLETLMKLRSAERQQRRAELAEAYHAEQVLIERMEAVSHEIAAVKGAAKNAASRDQIDAGQLLEMNRYELVLRARSAMFAEQKQQLHQEIERRREAVLEADRQVRVLEKLRERQLAAHVAREQRVENLHLDEIASRKARGPQS